MNSVVIQFQTLHQLPTGFEGKKLVKIGGRSLRFHLSLTHQWQSVSSAEPQMPPDAIRHC